MKDQKSTREKEVRQSLRENVDFLRSSGKNPYPSKSNRTSGIGDARENEKKFTNKPITLAGRLVALRVLGKSAFGKIEDETGVIQLFFSRENLGDEYVLIKKIDRGDFIEATGKMFRTKTDELTIAVESFAVLSKIQAPLPEKFHGLQDPEERQRRRYLDLLTNPETRERFRKRSQFVSNVRSFLDDADFLEVATPELQPIYGGAFAEPFVTRHKTLDMDLFLRIAPELYLKRLVVGGYERVYEISTNFRNEGMSPQHLQEFYELEMYAAYLNYEQMMQLCEKLLTSVIQKTFGTLVFEYQGKKLDFSAPWPRQDFRELVLRDTGIDVFAHTSKEALLADIKKAKLKLDIDPHASHSKVIDELYKTYSRPKIQTPTYLVHHPKILSPLAKESELHKGAVERFQLLAAGFEIMNGWSELNDPEEQKRRFQEQVEARKSGDAEAHQMDQDYIDALEYGMPPTAGMGMGIERIFALLTNQPSVRDVVLFPLFRPRS